MSRPLYGMALFTQCQQSGDLGERFFLNITPYYAERKYIPDRHLTMLKHMLECIL